MEREGVSSAWTYSLKVMAMAKMAKHYQGKIMDATIVGEEGEDK